MVQDVLLAGRDFKCAPALDRLNDGRHRLLGMCDGDRLPPLQFNLLRVRLCRIHGCTGFMLLGL